MSRNATIGLTLLAILAVVAWLLFGEQDRVGSSREAPISQASPAGAETRSANRPAANSDVLLARESAPNSEGMVAEASSVVAVDARTLTMCHRERLKQQGMEKYNCDEIPEGDVNGRNACRKQLEFVRHQLQQATAKAASCPERLAEPSEYYKALRDLANRGDVTAQRCFIQGYFGINRELGRNLTQVQRDEYAVLAKKFIQARFERGDWSVVRWLSKSRIEVSDLMLASAHPMGLDDRVNAYRIRRLLVLGNQPGLSKMPQDDPKHLVDFWRSERWLTPEQLEEAESWAQTMYSQHFIGSLEGASIGRADFCSDQ